MKALSPKNDFLFKEIFQNEDTEPLVNFLSEVLDLPERDFQTLTMAPEEQSRESVSDRLGILDIHVRTPEGLDIDVEVQVLRDRAMPERAMFYCSRMYTNQLHRGDSFAVLKRRHIVNVSVLGYRQFNDDRAHHTFEFVETTQHTVLSNTMQVHFLELPKAKGLPAMDDLKAWMLFLNATTEDKELLKMLKEHSEPMKKAVLRFEKLTADEEAREKAFHRERELLAEYSRMQTAKDEGLEQGRKKSQLEIARNLLGMALPVEQIAKATGLSEKEVRNLKQ